MPGFEEALAYLDSFVNYEQKPPDGPPPRAFGLERVRMLLDALGSPHKRLACIHVAGTKGKGSTAAMVESVLRTAGYRTGLYTSPHLVDVRERIRVGGEQIEPEAFARLMDRTRPHLDRVREDLKRLPPGAALRRPTYFEILTHIAFLYFEERAVDVAVLEVGLGGRLDATNVVERPLACAITNISRDHTAMLGETLGEIAREKAGILKAGVTAVVAPQRPSAAKAIRVAARRAGAPLWRVGEDVVIEDGPPREETRSATAGEGLAVRTPSHTYGGLTLPLWGAHQRENAAVAVGLAELARRSGLARVTDEAVRGGLARVRWPGRIQKVADGPVTILDGAHNRESVGALVRTLAERFPGARPVVVFAAAGDKDWKQMLEELSALSGTVIATTSGNPRAVPPHEIASAARRSFGRAESEEDPARALRRARELAGPDGLVVATGSLYLVGRLLPLFPET